MRAGPATVSINLQVVVVMVSVWVTQGEWASLAQAVAVLIALDGGIFISGVLEAEPYGEDPRTGLRPAPAAGPGHGHRHDRPVRVAHAPQLLGVVLILGHVLLGSARTRADPCARLPAMGRRRRTLAASLPTLLAISLSLPVTAADRDRDGLSDAFERRYGVTDPALRDSDHDGVIDSAEDNDKDRLGNLGEQRFGTNPGKRDTDGDGTADGQEDEDRDGRSNAQEQDQRRLPARLKPTIAGAKASYPPIRSRCLTGQGDSRPVACAFGSRGAGTRVVLIGDSHALMWSSPIRRIARNKGWRLLTMAKTACPALLGLYVQSQKYVDRNASCRAWRMKVMKRLQANPPDLVVLAHSDRYSLQRPNGLKYPKAQRPAIWKQALHRTLVALPQASKVLVIGNVPHNSGNPRKCLKRSGHDISACSSRRAGREWRKIEWALKATARARGAHYGAVYGKICSYDPCPLVQGNILIWRDKSHVTDTFARQLQPTFRAMLEAALR